MHVAGVVKTMPELVDHIVVVDDRSTDRTVEVAKAAAEHDDRTEVLQHKVNKGVGGSIVTGHRRAIEVGADVVVVMAGDGQMDPQHLPALIGPVVTEGYGFAKANRFYSAVSFRACRGTVSWESGPDLPDQDRFGLLEPRRPAEQVHSDPTRGARAAAARRLAERYEFENDQRIWLNILNVRAIDVSILARDGDETSTMRMHAVVPRLLRLLAVGFWRRIWRKYVLWSFSPVALLLFAGLALLLGGLAVGVWAVAASIGPGSASTGTWLLAVAPALVGIQFLVNALVLDIQATPT